MLRPAVVRNTLRHGTYLTVHLVLDLGAVQEKIIEDAPSEWIFVSGGTYPSV